MGNSLGSGSRDWRETKLHHRDWILTPILSFATIAQ
jgi:hypothetical protein